MARQKKAVVSDFYCTKCKERGIPIARTGKMREPGHLKKLYCLKCKKQTNFVEIRPFGQYNYVDFEIEFDNNNFDNEGHRIIKSYKQFAAYVRDGKWDKQTQTLITENIKDTETYKQKGADIYEW